MIVEAINKLQKLADESDGLSKKMRRQGRPDLALQIDAERAPMWTRSASSRTP